MKRVLVLGSGPIKIGQACEFDYSGTQACKALQEEGYEVILVNSNPATIMTDPEIATRTYIEPLTAEFVEKVIARERPGALLPTVGGQTALNLATELATSGTLARYGVELIGASLESISIAEDRERFRAKMQEIGMPVPRSVVVRCLSELDELLDTVPMPAIVRSAFTLGGTGSSTADNHAELRSACLAGLHASPISEVLIEESLQGWKEIELEVVRDRNDNFIVVCGIENFDPMGVHTGDSITVAPIQTLTDREYQALRDAAGRIIRAIGIDCGGANIQFAIDPRSGNFVVIEMNPRVSRSSALASKATGYPIARIAAKLAVGFTLDEVANDIIGSSACFEPAIDYVVTKIPRFNFEKFYGSSQRLGTEMRSVGEVMAIGATFKESFQKALRGLELDLSGFCEIPSRARPHTAEEWVRRLAEPSRYRATDIFCAYGCSMTVREVHRLSGIDRWFLDNLHELWRKNRSAIAEISALLSGCQEDDLVSCLPARFLQELKQDGFGDRQIAELVNCAVGRHVADEDAVYYHRRRLGIHPVFQAIDTCGGEFPTTRRYLYSTYFACAAARQEEGQHSSSRGKADEFSRSEIGPTEGKKVVILGGGPNRIGQGIEFDYCCVRASTALRELGFRTIMVNCNPETVSTDYDVSDTLYFEPLTLENVSNILEFEKPDGVIVQFGGQTPLNLAEGLEARGFKILGTDCGAIAMAEDRGKFRDVLGRLGIRQPESLVAASGVEALSSASTLGYPVVVRPSYVLGGRSMYIVRSRESMAEIVDSLLRIAPGRAILIDKFIEDAVEVDVDAVSDGVETVIAGIMQHVEPAGVHSGDSSCVLPALGLSEAVRRQIIDWTERIASALSVRGLINIQFAVKAADLYVLEVNPRASRTVPFVSKASGIPWVSVATRVIAGERLAGMKGLKPRASATVAVKSPLIPFDRFPGALVCLGPEMRSTGEVMGIGPDFASAFVKAQIAVGALLPRSGSALVQADPDCFEQALAVARAFRKVGWSVESSPELYPYLQSRGVSTGLLDIERPRAEELSALLRACGINRVVALSAIDHKGEALNTLKRAAIAAGVPLAMTYQECLALVAALEAVRNGADLAVASLQELWCRQRPDATASAADHVAFAGASALSPPASQADLPGITKRARSGYGQ
jgi:carbamoyl-phosphate synthase large subunit